MQAQVHQPPALPQAVLDNGKPARVETMVQLANKLIPMPRVVHRAMGMLRSHTSLQRIGQTLSTDASVAAVLLRLANSSFYRGASECRDVPSAVVRIGTHRLKEVLLAMAVMRPSVPETETAAELRARMAVHSASARVVALYLDTVDADSAFLTGLFSDIGQLLFCLSAGRAYGPLYQRWLQGEAPMQQLESGWAGFDHADVGVALLRKWEVPEAVASGVAHHHNLAELMIEDDRAGLALASAVAMSADITLALRGQRPRESVTGEALAAHEAQVFLGLDADVLENLYDECKQAAFELGAVFAG
jgi:HD-like signal output (HDOD) protein